MKGDETGGHRDADQAHLAAAGQDQGIAVDDLDHPLGLGRDQAGRERVERNLRARPRRHCGAHCGAQASHSRIGIEWRAPGNINDRWYDMLGSR